MENRIERVVAMEDKLNEALGAVDSLSAAIENYRKIMPFIEELSEYYGSPQWKEDFEADEKGLFPETLKRGVLSEDGIYNLLLRNREFLDEMAEICKRAADEVRLSYNE